MGDVVVVSVGQCGAALTQALLLRCNLTSGTKLRCVIVDSEHKAIRRLLAGEAKALVSPRNVVMDRPGRGGNWAYGYYDKQHVRSKRVNAATSAPTPQAPPSRQRREATPISVIAQSAHVRTSTSLQQPPLDLGLAFDDHTERPLLARAMEVIIREASACDMLSGFVLIHSLAGGTGSGLGSAVARAIRQEYSREFVLAVSVVPHQAGETALQHYNTALCLNVLNECTDAILLLENDFALKTLQDTALSAAAGLAPPTSASSCATSSTSVPHAASQASDEPRTVTLEDINQYFARGLACLLTPLNLGKLQGGSVASKRIELWDVCTNITAVPGCKFFQMHSITARKDSTLTAVDMLAKLQRSIPRRSASSQQIVHLNSQIIGRDLPDQNTMLDAAQLVKKTMSANAYAPWNPFPVDCKFDSSKRKTSFPILSFYSNNTSVTDGIRTCATRGREMLSVSAYLHWYERYGCERAEIEEAFCSMDTIVADYAYYAAP